MEVLCSRFKIFRSEGLFLEMVDLNGTNSDNIHDGLYIERKGRKTVKKNNECCLK